MENKIHDVARVLLNTGASIFGGYVRDRLANQIPTDIDVFGDMWEILKCLKGAGMKNTISDYQGDVITFESDGVRVDVKKSLPSLEELDFDVNGLVMTNSGIRCLEGLSFPEVLKHIQEKKARMMRADVPTYRIEKINARGFGIISQLGW